MIKINNYADHGEIFIHGDIVTDTEASWLKTLDDGTLGYQYPQKVKDELDELAGKSITVHIASDGGDVSAGIAIANMLKTHNAPTTAVIDSWAASIGSYIAFACNKIVMPENTFLMIHNPKCEIFGDGEYLRNVASWLDKIRDVIAETYAKHAIKAKDEKMTEKELIQMLMDKETWFTASEASNCFDNVEIADATEIKVVAKSMFKNPYVNEVNNEINEVANEVNNNGINNGMNNGINNGINGNNAEDIQHILNTLTEALRHEA